MKSNITSQAPLVQAIVLTGFLSEIDQVLPTVKGTEHRATIIKIQSLFMALLYSLIMGYLVPRFSVPEEILQQAIETLRCCGVAPSGWPQPPGPDALLRPGVAFVRGWSETAGTKGGEP